MTTSVSKPDLPSPEAVEKLWAAFQAEGKPTSTIQDGKTITCLVCGLTSYHPEDVKRGYCGYCHRFHERSER